jgi:hypothetical protein
MGCTIFYVDSNAPPGRSAYSSDVHEAVLEEVPDIFVLPELEFHATIDQWLRST